VVGGGQTDGAGRAFYSDSVSRRTTNNRLQLSHESEIRKTIFPHLGVADQRKLRAAANQTRRRFLNLELSGYGQLHMLRARTHTFTGGERRE
jgi:hypothetical protein